MVHCGRKGLDTVSHNAGRPSCLIKHTNWTVDTGKVGSMISEMTIAMSQLESMLLRPAKVFPISHCSILVSLCKSSPQCSFQCTDSAEMLTGRVTTFSDRPWLEPAMIAHSDLWPPASTRYFPPRDSRSPDPLSFSDSFSEKSYCWFVCENPRRPAVCEILGPAHVAPTTPPPVLASNLFVSNPLL